MCVCKLFAHRKTESTPRCAQKVLYISIASSDVMVALIEYHHLTRPLQLQFLIQN